MRARMSQAALSWLWDTLPRIAGYVFLLLLLAGIPLSQLLRQRIDRWLDARFAERMEQWRRTEEQHRRHLQTSVDRELDRVLRRQRRESDAVAEAWDRFYEAYWRARSTVSRIQQPRDFSRMSDAQQEDFIGRTRLSQWQKDEMLLLDDPEDRSRYYWRARQFALHARSEDARIAALDYVERRSLFIDAELRKLCMEINALISAALLEHETNIDTPRGRQQFKMIDRLTERGEPLMLALESRVQELL